MARSAAIPRSAADTALRTLSRSADKGRLWWIVATALALRKGPSRRGALRGLAGIAGASVTANLIAKSLFPRRRPAAHAVAEHRRLVRRPASSSFPSGHAASAAAFVTAVALESPLLGLVLTPLAAAVAYSRVHTGVHWPSDVGIGACLGIGAGLATQHWWPLPPTNPAYTAHRAIAPVMRDGDAMLAVVNPASGDSETDPADEVRAAWPKATILYPGPGVDLRDQLAEEIRQRHGRVRALGVAGGDGTVAAVASVAADHRLPLALIPTGTFNHFARDIGIRSVADADAATEAGAAVGVDLGEVEITTPTGPVRRWFVNTASLGGYPEMVVLRERLEQRHPTWPAAAIAMIRVLHHAQPLPVRINGYPMRVWMVFVGNGTYAPKGVVPPHRPALDTGLLDVRYIRADVRASRTRFLLAAVTNTLNASHVYREHDVTALDVEILDGYRRIATDGEVGPLGHRFRFRSRPSALTIYRHPRSPA